MKTTILPQNYSPRHVQAYYESVGRSCSLCNWRAAFPVENSKTLKAKDCVSYGRNFKPVRTKLIPFYLETQSVPRSKHTPSQLYKPVS
jgi:hypothetical protein